jgi:hypothetical protein
MSYRSRFRSREKFENVPDEFGFSFERGRCSVEGDAVLKYLLYQIFDKNFRKLLHL